MGVYGNNTGSCIVPGGRCIICIATRRAGFHLDSCNFLSRCWTLYKSRHRGFYRCVRSSRTLGMESGGWRLFLRLLAANTFLSIEVYMGKRSLTSGKTIKSIPTLQTCPPLRPRSAIPMFIFLCSADFSFLYNLISRVVHNLFRCV